jgi:predicted lipoprotein with Yx(FWY)xxD motif
MRSRFALLAVFPVLASIVIASLGPGGAAQASTAEPAAKKRGAKLKLVGSEFGRAVMNGKGRVLYLFDKETTRTPQCYGDCAVAWPPFLTKGKPVAGEGLDQKLVGTTLRTDGRRQVTYRGHPLYYYVHDSPGVILCQDVFEFGGRWLIVNRRGNAIR